jgi:hypothetical protein
MRKELPRTKRTGEPINQKRENTMEVIIRSPGSLLEEVVLECPGLTWNQVFCELDRMSRAGQVRVTIKGPGLYVVSSATARNSSVERKERWEDAITRRERAPQAEER